MIEEPRPVLWEFRRDHRFGEPEWVRLYAGGIPGTLLLEMFTDHAEWEQVVLDYEDAWRLVAALMDPLGIDRME